MDATLVTPAPTTPTTTKADNHQNQNINPNKKHKRFSLFKAAMYMIRPPKNAKPKAQAIKPVNNNVTNKTSDEKWKKVIGSMRPLTLQDNQSPPHENPVVARSIKAPTGQRAENTNVDEVHSPTSSSSSSWATLSQYASTNNLQEVGGRLSHSSSDGNLHERASSRAGSFSQYGSAPDLHDLDVDIIDDDEEEEGDKVLENREADVMIDKKAEEFIAQFYQQIKSQHKRKSRN